MTNERRDALALADRLLDVPYADPDDDLRVLCRQLLRAQEEIERLEHALAAVRSAIRRDDLGQELLPEPAPKL